MMSALIRKNTILLCLLALFIQTKGQPFDIYEPYNILELNPSDKLYQNYWDHVNIWYNSLSKELVPDTLILDIFPHGYHSFAFPTPTSNKVISRFGKRGSRFHSGTDIKINHNDTILAAFDGKVRLSRWFYGYGYVVAIRHYNGLETISGHLSKILVKENQWVKAGSPIGLGGQTGRATTAHLHFETRILGIPINSEEYIDFEKGELKANVLYFNKEKRELRSEWYLRDELYEPVPLLPSISNIKVITKY
jgi:murein DD-endopeptidase MepM/ murein hydrolase activator NlpD